MNAGDAFVYIPEDLKEKIPKLYETENDENPLLLVKLFTPWSNWTWYVIEWDGADLCFGYVIGHEAELGYFSLAEIETLRGPAGLRIERDLNFQPKRLEEIRESLGKRGRS